MFREQKITRYVVGLCQTGDSGTKIKNGNLTLRIDGKNCLRCCSAEHHKISHEVDGSQAGSNQIDSHLDIPVW